MRGVLQNSCFFEKYLRRSSGFKNFQTKGRIFNKIVLIYRYFLTILTAGTEEQHCRKVFFRTLILKDISKWPFLIVKRPLKEANALENFFLLFGKMILHIKGLLINLCTCSTCLDSSLEISHR